MIDTVSCTVIKPNVLGRVLGGGGGACLLPYVSYRYPPLDETGAGRLVLALLQMTAVRLNGPPFVCPHFVSEAELGNPWMDFFNFAHTHPLIGSLDVSFGFFENVPTQIISSICLIYYHISFPEKISEIHGWIYFILLSGCRCAFLEI